MLGIILSLSKVIVCFSVLYAESLFWEMTSPFQVVCQGPPVLWWQAGGGLSGSCRTCSFLEVTASLPSYISGLAYLLPGFSLVLRSQSVFKPSSATC
jgi:hypothetical protein